MTRHTLPFVLLAALLAMPAAVTAQLYKWVDEDGGVNYGDTPPPKAKNVRPVGQGSVSVVPGVPKDQIDAMRERDEQRRKEREQRDADQARAAEMARAAAPREPQYADSYVPDYGYWPIRTRPPDIGKNRPRPEKPIARPKTPAGAACNSCAGARVCAGGERLQRQRALPPKSSHEKRRPRAPFSVVKLRV